MTTCEWFYFILFYLFFCYRREYTKLLKLSDDHTRVGGTPQHNSTQTLAHTHMHLHSATGTRCACSWFTCSADRRRRTRPACKSSGGQRDVGAGCGLVGLQVRFIRSPVCACVGPRPSVSLQEWYTLRSFSAPVYVWFSATVPNQRKCSDREGSSNARAERDNVNDNQRKILLPPT